MLGHYLGPARQHSQARRAWLVPWRKCNLTLQWHLNAAVAMLRPSPAEATPRTGCCRLAWSAHPRGLTSWGLLHLSVLLGCRTAAVAAAGMCLSVASGAGAAAAQGAPWGCRCVQLLLVCTRCQRRRLVGYLSHRQGGWPVLAGAAAFEHGDAWNHTCRMPTYTAVLPPHAAILHSTARDTAIAAHTYVHGYASP